MRAPNGEPRRFVQEALMTATLDCIDWPFADSGQGYPSNFVDYDGEYHRPHVRVCELAWGERPSQEHEARHLCGRRICINARHLAWGTAEQNAADREEHGRTARGEKNGTAKLTPVLVREIRQQYLDGVLVKDMAERLGLYPLTLSNAISGKTWAHVDDPEPVELRRRATR